jgi:hypothetical protein
MRWDTEEEKIKSFEDIPIKCIQNETMERKRRMGQLLVT